MMSHSMYASERRRSTIADPGSPGPPTPVKTSQKKKMAATPHRKFHESSPHQTNFWIHYCSISYRPRMRKGNVFI